MQEQEARERAKGLLHNPLQQRRRKGEDREGETSYRDFQWTLGVATLGGPRTLEATALGAPRACQGRAGREMHPQEVSKA